MKPDGANSFLDKLSIASLLWPVTDEEFRARHWEQLPLVVERGNPDYYGDLFTLQDFDDAITRTPAYVKLANAVTQKNVSYKAEEAPGLEAVLADMRAGGTLVLDQLHQREPKLAMLCRLLAREFGHRFQTNLYLTPPGGKGFSPHWDNHDVFILQVSGSKHWKIEKDRRALPGKNDKMGDDGRELRGEIHSFTLARGDMVYIPRGYVHAAESGAEHSLHITVGVTAIFLEDVLHAAVTAAVKQHDWLRMTLPIGFMDGRGEDIVSRAVAGLQKAADEEFMSKLVERYRDDLVTKFPLDVSGQVVDFFQPRPITLEDRFAPRRGLVYRLHEEDGCVRLNFGARTITFASFFGKSLEFAVKTNCYKVRDIVGELEDAEKLVFVERLVEEGILVRQ